MKALTASLTLLAFGSAACPVAAQTDTSFTYQGELRDNGALADGAFAMDFTLFDAASDGNVLGVVNLPSVPVAAGVFTAELDFGVSPFDDAPRWLEITVAGTTLTPRTAVTRAPYAIQTRGVFVDGDHHVGIGGADADNRLTVVTDSDVAAVRGVNDNPLVLFGANYGVRGEVLGGCGVHGLARATSGEHYGVCGVSNSPAGFDFYADGAGMDYGSSSSIRWKRNVEPIAAPLEKLARVRGVAFDWDAAHGGKRDVGVIAEEVGHVLPEIVAYEQNGVDAIGLDYSKLTPLLVEAAKALHERDAAKDALIAEQQRTINALNARVARLEALVRQHVSK